MRAGLLAFALAMVAAACGTSETSSDGGPTVEIASIELDGQTASIGFEVAAEGALPTVQVNWGDDTLSPEIRGEGSLDDTHTYADDVAEATIVVTAVDEEGSVASAARSISLAGATTVPGDDSVPRTTTTTTDLASTTTAIPTTTTPATTSPPATTAPVPPDTPAPPPPTAATTTLPPPPPPPEDVVIELDPAAAGFSGTNDGSKQRAERIGPGTIGVFASAGGNGARRSSSAALTWEIPPEELAVHGTTANIAVLLEPTLSAALHTDGADGNSAGFDMQVSARQGGSEVNSGVGTPYSIGPGDDLSLDGVPDRVGFGSTIEVDGPLTVVWTITCRASGADSLFLPLSISECDALDGARGVSLGTARLTVKAPDG